MSANRTKQSVPTNHDPHELGQGLTFVKRCEQCKDTNKAQSSVDMASTVNLFAHLLKKYGIEKPVLLPPFVAAKKIPVTKDLCNSFIQPADKSTKAMANSPPSSNNSPLLTLSDDDQEPAIITDEVWRALERELLGCESEEMKVPDGPSFDPLITDENTITASDVDPVEHKESRTFRF